MTDTTSAPAGSIETIRLWDAVAQEYRRVTVTAEPVKRTRTRRVAKQAPAARIPLDNPGAPIPEWWQDTAYAPMGPLADMRTWVKPASMRTHRPAVVVPADPGRITEVKR